MAMMEMETAVSLDIGGFGDTRFSWPLQGTSRGAITEHMSDPDQCGPIYERAHALISYTRGSRTSKINQRGENHATRSESMPVVLKLAPSPWFFFGIYGGLIHRHASQ